MNYIEKKEEHQSVDGLSCGCGHCLNDKKVHNEDKINIYVKEYIFSFCKIGFSIAFFIVAFFTSKIVSIILFSLSALIVGYELIINFVKNIIKLNFFDENTLMTVASITAFILGEYFEGALILILFFTGEFLEKIATDNSKRKIAGLSKLKSKVAHLISKNGMKDVDPNDVEVGSLIEVKSGEIVPIDGVLIGLSAEFDMKTITGESKYRTIDNGGVVYSGSINVGNPVVIKTIKAFKDSTVENIIEMVEGSLSKKSKSQKFITTFAKIYTPIIFVLAIAISIIPPLFDHMDFIKWIYKALSFLVISCPCALIISVPLSFFVGIGGLAKIGVMVKGSRYIDILSRVKTVVFDKTGTLTTGDFIIDKIELVGDLSERTVLEYVGCLEENSSHPIAKAICSGIDKSSLTATNIKEIKGRGMCGVIEQKNVCVGNSRLMSEKGIEVCDEFAGTVLYLAIDNVLQAKLFIIDAIKLNATKSIKRLKNLGVNNSIILSGDNNIIVESVAKEIGIDQVFSELLPSDKVEKLKDIKNKCSDAVMFVGDGINDSPSLAMSDVGVAMGGLGSEIATSSADIVIMDDNLEKIPVSISHAKKVKRTVLQNIIGSLTVKFTIMLLSVIIYLPVWIAMFADVGVMLLAVCNSLRAGKVKR